MKLSSISTRNLFAFGAVLALALVVMIPALAMAGGGGTEFATIYTTLTGWMTGTLGKIITVALIITGVAMGVVRQTIIAAVPGVAAGLVMNYAPGVVDAIVAATI